MYKSRRKWDSWQIKLDKSHKSFRNVIGMVGKRHVHMLSLAWHKGSYLQRDGHVRAGYRRLKYLNII